MSRYEWETVALMAAVGAACAVPGVFLLLRRLVMVGDAISHVLLFGVVVGYLLVGDPTSPWLLAGAAASGVLTVALVELLQSSNRVKADAAVGLVFPALFAGGVLLASMYLRNTHLDVDRVLLGSAELAFLDRMSVGGASLPRGLVVLLAVSAATCGLLAAGYKELKLAAFDAGLAATLGFAPAAVHYAVMTCVSLTTVAAFDAVGPVLVLAFFAVPPAAARLLTDRLSRMLAISVLFAVAAAVVGTRLAVQLDTNIAGTVTSVLGLLFAVVFLAAPHRGLIAEAVRRFRQRRAFHETMLTIHLHRHAHTPAEADEAAVDRLHVHLGWPAGDAAAVARRAERHGLVRRAGGLLKLTPTGLARATDALNISA